MRERGEKHPVPPWPSEGGGSTCNPPSCPPPSSPRSAPAISASAVPDVFPLVTALRDKAKLLELLLWAGGQIQKSELGVWLAQLMWPHTLSFPRLRRGKRGRRGLDVQFCYGKGSVMCWPFNKEGVLYLGSLKLVVSMWPLSPGCSLAGKMVTKSQNLWGSGKPQCRLLARARLCWLLY